MRLVITYHFKKLTVTTYLPVASQAYAKEATTLIRNAIVESKDENGQVVLTNVIIGLEGKAWRDWKVVHWLIRKLEEWIPEAKEEAR